MKWNKYQFVAACWSGGGDATQGSICLRWRVFKWAKFISCPSLETQAC